MFAYIGKHWKGELSLAQSFFVNNLGLNLAIYSLTVQLHQLMATESPTHTAKAILASKVLTLCLMPWQLVGLWRATKKTTPSLKLTLEIYIAAITLGILQSLIKDRDAIPDLFRLGFLPDPLGTYTVSTNQAGNTLSISGHFGFGISDEVEKHFAENPGIKLIILNSPGGYIYEGRRTAKFFAQKQLITVSTQECSSICTLPYLAGRQRLLGPGAELGFHQYHSLYQSFGSLSEQQRLDRKLLTEFGISESFIDKIYSVNSQSIWKPDHDILIKQGIINEILAVPTPN